MSTSTLSILWAVVGAVAPLSGHETPVHLALPSDSLAPPQRPVPADETLALDGERGPILAATLNVRYVATRDTPEGFGGEGTELSDALFAIEGHWYGYDVSLAFDFDETNGTTLDRAWVQGRLDDRHRLRFGLLRRPFLWSSFADESEFVFPYRSRLGREFALSDEGVELLADYTVADVRVALTNGADGTSDARQGTARVGFHFVGERPLAGERPRGGDGLSLFLAYTDEGSVTDGDAYAAELHGQLGRQRLHVEWLDAADGVGDQRGATGTWSLALDQGVSEVAVRVEHLREPDRRTILGLAYGHSFLRDVVRAQVAVECVQSGDAALEGWLLSAGFVLTL